MEISRGKYHLNRLIIKGLNNPIDPTHSIPAPQRCPISTGKCPISAVSHGEECLNSAGFCPFGTASEPEEAHTFAVEKGRKHLPPLRRRILDNANSTCDSIDLAAYLSR
jgi:hypothetical protein